MEIEEIGIRIREIIPGAVFGEDNDGQLIIYTNLQISEDGNHVEEFEEGEPAH